MPAEFSNEAIGMLTAGAIVAAWALPCGFIAWLIARARQESLVPQWQPWRAPWGGFEVLAAFVVVAVMIPSLLATTRLLPMAVGVVALPIQLAFLVIASRLLFPASWFRVVSPWSRITFAVLAWAIITPLILCFHAAVLEVFNALNWKPDEHPLAKFDGSSIADQALFLVRACLAAPLIEEILFRGVLLPWTVGLRERNAGPLGAPPLAPPVFRPWIVMGFALFFSASGGKLGPIVFASVLAVGLAIVWVTVRRGKRHVRGIYASAAMFAMVHSAVWPSPIPLFLLGLSLGWCAVRTRGVLVPAIVHGLFNAVSAVYVLRGGPG